MKAMSDKESAAFWKEHADYLEKQDAAKEKELFKAIRGLCRTLGVDVPMAGGADAINKIDATMKRRLAGK